VVARHIQREPRFRRTVLKVILKAVSPFNQVSGGPRQVIQHLERGIFYFRKPEYEFFLDQVEYLLGTRLDEFFGWYFQKNAPPCHRCGEELYRCGCERYEELPAGAGEALATWTVYAPPPRSDTPNAHTREMLGRLARLPPELN
jgi:hypothetical protein